MSEDMDISVDLILASATPVELQHDKSRVACAQKKAANITLSCDLGHAETAPSGNFFSETINAIKL
ncbi:hypothetical protein AB3Y13_21445 [Vibrio alginolyticus]